MIGRLRYTMQMISVAERSQSETRGLTILTIGMTLKIYIDKP